MNEVPDAWQATPPLDLSQATAKTPDSVRALRIFVAGISTETNMFSNVPTGLEDFAVVRGSDPQEHRDNLRHLDLSALWGSQAEANGCVLLFSLMALAPPFGVTVRSAYEELRDAILSDLAGSLPVDIVLLNLHGAMVADGYDDCEEDLVTRARKLVGPEAVIGVELDLHCHLSEAKIRNADLVITYKEYPHTDVDDRGHELFDLALLAARGAINPTMALADCRAIGFFPTSRQPLRRMVDEMKSQESSADSGILSISFGHGFPCADLPHLGAKMLVVANNDPALAQSVADYWAGRIYEQRGALGFDKVSLPVEEAFARAEEATAWPVVIADQSDNVGGGAPGDATFVLRWIVEKGIEDVACAIFYDPEVVRIAKKAGIGARLNVRLGGKLGPASGVPLDLKIEVGAILPSYFHLFPQDAGPPQSYPCGDLALLRAGTIDIVVSSERCQCFSPSIFSDCGVDPGGKKILVPKSYQHFYGAFAKVASDIIYMAGGGAVAPDPRQNEYRRIDTAMFYPWNEQ